MTRAIIAVLVIMGRAMLLATIVLHGAPAIEAWDLFGHHVIGAIAWESLGHTARKDAVELLLAAPSDAGLAALYPPNGRAAEDRARELFPKAAGWADLVRDETEPRRKERYDRPTWHYVNRFWRPTPSGPERIESMGPSGELVERLVEAKASVADESRPAAERALALAWLLHLAGDIHQPLHASARVTEREPGGDRGGNDFLVADPEASNLHAYWDAILGRVRRRYHSEGYFSWVRRVADELSTLHPRATLLADLRTSDPAEWARESAELARSAVYPGDLSRGATPSRAYRTRAFEIASRRAALAGYRTARLVTAALGERP